MPFSEARSSKPVSTYQQALQASGEDYGRRAQPAQDVLDTDLVQAALDGDFVAFESLVTRYERKAFWLAFHVLGQVEESRDVVQEAFVRVYKSLNRFDFAKNFYTWLYRIVTNLAIDSLRKNKHRTLQLDDFGDSLEHGNPDEPQARLEGKELSQRVREVLDQMHPRFRTILALRDLHGISCREIAPILALTYATVRWRLHKARQLFRERWERAAEASDEPADK